MTEITNNEEVVAVNWTVPRKNWNSAKQAPNPRSNTWTFEVYPESAVDNWEMVLTDTFQVLFATSPLHDKDVNEDGEKKKLHWHVIVQFDSMKSFKQIDEIARAMHAPVPQVVDSPIGLIQYFVHKNNPEKYQYSRSDIRVFGLNALVEKAFAVSSADKWKLLDQLTDYIFDHDIRNAFDLRAAYRRGEISEEWWNLTHTDMYYIQSMMTGAYQHAKQMREESFE